MPGQIMVEGMAAALRLERERKGRIRIDIDALDRIHLDRHRQSHWPLPCPALRWTNALIEALAIALQQCRCAMPRGVVALAGKIALERRDRRAIIAELGI